MENDNQTLIDTNIEAFKCEMRAFPHVDIESPELLRQNRDDLNKLGLVYYLGLGGPEDREEAKRLWAKSNDGEAKLFLSVDRFLENDLSGGAQLLAEASKMGIHWARMMSKNSMSDTAAGTKKNPRFLTRKLAMPSTCSRRITRKCNKAVSNNIPIMLEGNFMPVSHTTSSPSARHPKMIAH